MLIQIVLIGVRASQVKPLINHREGRVVPFNHLLRACNCERQNDDGNRKTDAAADLGPVDGLTLHVDTSDGFAPGVECAQKYSNSL